MSFSLRALRVFLASDEGRISRKQFWLFLLGAVAFAMLLLSLPVIGLPAVMPVAISVILIFPSYCVIAKRLQDIGIDGQWAIAMSGIAAIDALWIAAGPAGALTGFVALLRGLWWWLALGNTLAFVVLGLWPGEQGHNRYGEPVTNG